MGYSPYGPFKYMGKIAPEGAGAQDHHAILEIKGQSYYFYHVGNYNRGNRYRRNVCVDYLYCKDNGEIQEVIQTAEGVKAIILP